MNKEVSQAHQTSLLFEWTPLKGEKFLISVFLVGSVFLHAVAFYMFRIIYPPAIAVLPPPARVNVISPNSQEGQTLLQWIEAEDPALASATLRPADIRTRALPKLQHVPSYMIQEPKPKEAPPLDIVPAAPTAFPPGPVSVFGKSQEQAWARVPSRVSFSEELNTFGEAKFPPTQFAASSGEPPENVTFRVAVDAQGAIHYCFRLNSSGDSALDEQSRKWLVGCRFRPRALRSGDGGGADLVWGLATIEWGNDVAHPAHSPTPVEP